MRDALALLATPVFWITTVFAGIAINLISAYAQRPLDRLIDRITEGRRVRSELEKKDLDQKAWAISQHSELIQFEFQLLVQRLFAALMGLLSAAFLTSMAAWLQAVGGRFPVVVRAAGITALFIGFLIAMVLSMRSLNRVTEASQLLGAARKYRRRQIADELRAGGKVDLRFGEPDKTR